MFKNDKYGSQLLCVNLRTGVLRIAFNIPSNIDGKKVRIYLYDQRGVLVKKLIDNSFGAGPTTISVDAGTLATGQYLLELCSQGIRKNLQVAVLR